MTAALIERLSEVQPERVRWLWRGYIPLGKLTVVDGDPGLGKTTALLDVAARVTTGRPMPDGTRADLDGPANVVLLTAEDGLADTIRPRLDAAGADPSRVVALRAMPDDEGERPIEIPFDVQAIADAVEAERAALVIIDPLMAFLGSNVNSFRDQDVRRALAHLSRLAEETGAALTLIRHLNKATGGSALYRGGGSIGIIGAARAGLLVARDPDDETRCVVAVSKSNLGPTPSALAYRLHDAGNDVARVVWEGPTSHTAAQLLSQPGTDDERSALNDAVAFLNDLLSDGPMPSKDVQRQYREAGFSDITIRRAKDRAGVVVERSGFGAGGVWTWALGHRCSPNRIDDHPKTVSIYGPDDHLWAPNGSAPTLRCRGCSRSVRGESDPDRPGWLRFACPCGTVDFVRADDPALMARDRAHTIEDGR